VRKLVCSFAFFALLVPILSWAAPKENKKSFTIADPVQVQNVTLSPGNYEVTWTQMGDNVPVTILKGHKPIATITASVVNQTGPYKQGTLELQTQPNGAQELMKIDFSRVAVILPPA